MSTGICLSKVILWVGKSFFWITTSLLHLVAGHFVADALFKLISNLLVLIPKSSMYLSPFQ